jgi:hypothetical protein
MLHFSPSEGCISLYAPLDRCPLSAGGSPVRLIRTRSLSAANRVERFERLLHLAPALDGNDHSADAVALSQHQLLELAVLQLGEHRAEVPHRLTNGAELVRADPQ